MGTDDPNRHLPDFREIDRRLKTIARHLVNEFGLVSSGPNREQVDAALDICFQAVDDQYPEAYAVCDEALREAYTLCLDDKFKAILKSGWPELDIQAAA